jgi:rhodanese-related sulfurtransferase
MTGQSVRNLAPDILTQRNSCIKLILKSKYCMDCVNCRRRLLSILRVGCAGSLNIPLKELQQRLGEVREAAAAGDGDGRTVVALCRRGNDSQLAVQQLEEAGIAPAVDLINGLTAWHTNVDRSFPKY